MVCFVVCCWGASVGMGSVLLAVVVCFLLVGLGSVLLDGSGCLCLVAAVARSFLSAVVASAVLVPVPALSACPASVPGSACWTRKPAVAAVAPAAAGLFPHSSPLLLLPVAAHLHHPASVSLYSLGMPQEATATYLVLHHCPSLSARTLSALPSLLLSPHPLHPLQSSWGASPGAWPSCEQPSRSAWPPSQDRFVAVAATDIVAAVIVCSAVAAVTVVVKFGVQVGVIEHTCLPKHHVPTLGEERAAHRCHRLAWGPGSSSWGTCFEHTSVVCFSAK